MFRTLLLCALAAAAAGCTTAPSSPIRHASQSASASPMCVRASRIPDDNCGTAGSKWSDKDLERTGQTNPADALATLDPTVQAHH
jgi:hypothetical protein